MSVVSLFTERMKRLRVKNPDPALVYVCLRCEGQLFKISAMGDVVCANGMCGALMRNLRVEKSEPAA